MKTVEISAAPRAAMTKNQNRRLRLSGSVPAILYGRHMEKSVPLLFNSREFSKIIHTTGRTCVLSLKSDDTALNGKSALVKDIQRDSMSDHIDHVDLLEINMSEKIHVSVDLEFKGSPEPIKTLGAVLEISMRQINLECLPMDIPSYIEVDVSKMELNDVFHVKDLQLPTGVKVLDHDDASVIALHVPKEQPDYVPAETIDGETGQVVGEEAAVAEAAEPSSEDAAGDAASKAGAAPAGSKDATAEGKPEGKKK